MRFYFRKKEKLTSEKEIDLLFTSGKSGYIYPIKSLYAMNTAQINECKVLVTVSKRYLKNASDRNLVKRRIREAFRLNASSIKALLLKKSIALNIAFIYSSSKIISYDKIEPIVIKHLSNILSVIEKSEKDS